ncbi:uncharacterized protein METZ01_LOCUS247446 [marine metagenome]|uniref:Uncharacterized protein n=1 Tax=marine metagenome TaxID=408172 RepID=A0A382I5I7_9ZZZZ
MIFLFSGTFIRNQFCPIKHWVAVLVDHQDQLPYVLAHILQRMLHVSSINSLGASSKAAEG